MSCPAILVINFFKNIPHQMLRLIILLLNHPHIQLHFPKEPLTPTLLPLPRFRLRITSGSFSQHQLSTVQVQPGCHFLIRYAPDVRILRTDPLHLPVQIRRPHVNHILQNLNEHIPTCLYCALHIPLIS